MFTALITFLGGVTFRVIIGNLFDFLNKWQDQRNELDRIREEAKADEAQHKRHIEAVRAQYEMGIKVIETQAQAHVTAAEADAIVEAVRATSRQTGIKLVDLWNGIIRPLLASVCIALWISSLYQRNWVLDDWDRALMSMALGIFIGGRIHTTGR